MYSGWRIGVENDECLATSEEKESSLFIDEKFLRSEMLNKLNMVNFDRILT